jgi:GAF domain-containing protein
LRTGSKAGSPNESFETGVDGEPLFKFLDRLGQEIARSTDADTILAITTRLTAQHLGLSNCAYADMDEDEDGFTIRGNWHAAGSPSIVGRYSLADFGTLAVRELSAGRPGHRSRAAPSVPGGRAPSRRRQAGGQDAPRCLPHQAADREHHPLGKPAARAANDEGGRPGRPPRGAVSAALHG